MKKCINYESGPEENQYLKEQKISHKLLPGYAPDEIAVIPLCVSPKRTGELQAQAEFRQIPSPGIVFAERLIAQGYYSPEELKGKTAADLSGAFEKNAGCRAGLCVEDSYRPLANCTVSKNRRI